MALNIGLTVWPSFLSKCPCISLGYCYSYEYECENGRCIDDSIKCNGFNPCGDGSDCRLSAGVIVGIVLGSLFCVCVFSAIVFVIVKNRRKRKNQVGFRFICTIKII